jgi:hypothetical protein
MILNFKKEINVIIYIIELEEKKVNSKSFHFNNISIKYEFSKFMFLYCLK